MRRLWISKVEILTEPNENGDARAFTNVIAWASSARAYSETVRAVAGKYDWTELGVGNARCIADSDEFCEDITELIASARGNPRACIFATFHYHPSRVS
jgi:hypothetical protein